MSWGSFISVEGRGSSCDGEKNESPEHFIFIKKSSGILDKIACRFPNASSIPEGAKLLGIWSEKANGKFSSTNRFFEIRKKFKETGTVVIDGFCKVADYVLNVSAVEEKRQQLQLLLDMSKHYNRPLEIVEWVTEGVEVCGVTRLDEKPIASGKFLKEVTHSMLIDAVMGYKVSFKNEGKMVYFVDRALSEFFNEDELIAFHLRIRFSKKEKAIIAIVKKIGLEKVISSAKTLEVTPLEALELWE